MNRRSLSPKKLGYRWPAEWESHRATWLVWPHNDQTWPGRFAAARQQFARFVKAICKYEQVELIASGPVGDSTVQSLGELSNCRLHSIPTNDSWIRDHGPIFLQAPADQPPLLLDWQYNAWGNKYPPFDLDNDVPRRIAVLTGHQRRQLPVVLEGGSVEGNGHGLLMTTESCLLHPHRNPDLHRAQLEQYLREFLCVDHIIWLTGEIPGDDTDGHIDQIGRFVGAQTVLLADLPGSDMFQENRTRLQHWSKSTGIDLQVLRVVAPKPRQVDGMWLPASYANFCFVNGAVLVPTFDDPADEPALRVIAECFPERQIVDVAASDLVFGLGALHCLSQQEPAALIS